MTAPPEPLQVLLERLRMDWARAGLNDPGPASEAALDTTRQALAAQLGAALPGEYAAFLGRCNGLDFNGTVLYAALPAGADSPPWNDLLSGNLAWRERPDLRRVLVLGDTSLDLLVTDLDGGDPRQLDRVSGEVMERHPSVTALVCAALWAVLD